MWYRSVMGLVSTPSVPTTPMAQWINSRSESWYASVSGVDHWGFLLTASPTMWRVQDASRNTIAAEEKLQDLVANMLAAEAALTRHLLRCLALQP